MDGLRSAKCQGGEISVKMLYLWEGGREKRRDLEAWMGRMEGKLEGLQVLV